MKRQTKVLLDKETKTIIKAEFDKFVVEKDYEVFFNTKTGFEVLRGTGGKPDPFWTKLPLLCDIGIMGSCPNRCEFCYQGDKTEPHMTLENFKKIIDEVKHHTNQVALGGRGDPNLHPQFKEIVEYARNNNVVPNYTTSGIGLTDEQIKVSKLCGAVAVSDYGRSYTYEAIQSLIDAGIKTNIHMIFTRYTADKVSKIIYGYNPWFYRGESSVDIDALNAVIFLLFKPQGSGADLNWQPTKLQLKSFSEKVMKAKCLFKVGMDSCLVNWVVQNIKMTKRQKMSLDTCEGSRMSVYISPNMVMMPCSFANEADYGVQISEKKTIDYIWNRSIKFKRFRSILKKNKACCPAGF